MNPKIFGIDDFLETSLGYYDKIDSGPSTRGLESADISLDLEKSYPEEVVFNQISDVLRSIRFILYISL